MMTINVPPFNMGSPNQIRAATFIRQGYIEKLVDRGFEQEDIQKLIDVRCVATWWLTNKSKLGVMDTVRHFKAVDKLIAKHGSVDAAADYAIDVAYKQEMKTAEYIYNSTPMFKL